MNPDLTGAPVYMDRHAPAPIDLGDPAPNPFPTLLSPSVDARRAALLEAERERLLTELEVESPRDLSSGKFAAQFQRLGAIRTELREINWRSEMRGEKRH